MCGGSPREPPTSLEFKLLAFVGFDGFLDFGLYGVQIESGRVLHGRIVDGGHSKLGNGLLNNDKAPELTGHEVIYVASGTVVKGFPTSERCALEGVLPNVYDCRH